MPCASNALRAAAWLAECSAPKLTTLPCRSASAAIFEPATMCICSVKSFAPPCPSLAVVTVKSAAAPSFAWMILTRGFCMTAASALRRVTSVGPAAIVTTGTGRGLAFGLAAGAVSAAGSALCTVGGAAAVCGAGCGWAGLDLNMHMKPEHSSARAGAATETRHPVRLSAPTTPAILFVAGITQTSPREPRGVKSALRRNSSGCSAVGLDRGFRAVCLAEW